MGGLGPRPRLQVKEDAHSRVFVAGLSEARPPEYIKARSARQSSVSATVQP